MPYNWKDEYIESQANKRTDALGFGEIGGVGQLIYHVFTFKKYRLEYDHCEAALAIPVIDQDNGVHLPDQKGYSGAELLVSLCNLAKSIDDPKETRPCAEMIIDWCRAYSHPYAIDEIYGEMTDSAFDFETDSFLLEKDGIFPINQFMKDLEKLYNTVRFYDAIEGIKKKDNRKAFSLYSEGRYFTGYPFFERFKVGVYYDELEIDFSAAEGDLVKEMQIEREYIDEHHDEIIVVGEDDFEVFPQQHLPELQETLLECFPDYTLRLKKAPGKNRVMFAADVHSVFDIAWYSFARLLAEEPIREIEKEQGISRDRDELIINCRHCGKYMIRRSNRQEYCDSPECQKARNANNQREFRRRRATEKAKGKIALTENGS